MLGRSSLRGMSLVASNWVSRFRYGFDGGPTFGSTMFSSACDVDHKLAYCRALVYASGGGRVARDWIAGAAAVAVADASLTMVALQHSGAEADITALLEGLKNEIDPRCADRVMQGTCPHGRAPPEGSYSPAASVPRPRDAVPSPLPPCTGAPTATALTDHQRQTIINCFVYDVLKACVAEHGHVTSFTKNVLLERLGAKESGGVTAEFLQQLEAVVEEETAINKEKRTIFSGLSLD